jgi:hypothetical protein
MREGSYHTPFPACLLDCLDEKGPGGLVQYVGRVRQQHYEGAVQQQRYELSDRVELYGGGRSEDQGPSGQDGGGSEGQLRKSIRKRMVMRVMCASASERECV